MKLSVITPTKNSCAYIIPNLESVHLLQSNLDIEHIIIDGNSEDSTLDIITEFKELYGADIKIVESKDDEGMYHAINKGMRLITGDVWSELNSDDMYYPGTVDKILSNFKNRPEIDVVYGNVDMVNELGKFIHTLYLPKFKLEYLILKGYCLTILQPAMFLRKSVIDTTGFFNTDYKYASDYDYCIRLGKNQKLIHIDHSLTKYRIHTGSITWGNSERRAIQTNETKEISNKYINDFNIKQKSILLDDITLYRNQLHKNNLPYIFKRLNEIFSQPFRKKH